MSDTPTTTVSAVMKMGAADVLDTIANLSNDEVFTPPKLANQVLDLLPKHVWSDSSLKFLDPCVKTGVFLREIVKRLMIGLKDEIKDEGERREHILRNQIYGIAITELTALMSRRTVYCSSDATRQKNDDMPENCYSAVIFEKSEGNIAFPSVGHRWPQKKKGVIAQTARCEVCGANYSEFTGDDREGMESYAYPFIHMDIQEIFGEMQFDVVIGNPPYQIADNGGDGSSARHIYQEFIYQAERILPKYISMIIPARWMNGGKGLSEFKERMFSLSGVKHIMDFSSSERIFPGLTIAGGVCFYLWERGYSGPTVHAYHSDTECIGERSIEDFNGFIRDPISADIIKKVRLQNNQSMKEIVFPRNLYNIPSKFSGRDGHLTVHTAKGTHKIDGLPARLNLEHIESYRVLISKAAPGRGGAAGLSGKRKMISRIFIAEPLEVCSESFLVIGEFNSKEQAESLATYLRTKFARFMLASLVDTQNISKEKFANVPMIDWTRVWCDDVLNEHFSLSVSEIDYINKSISEFS